MRSPVAPSLTLDLAWEGEMRFAGTAGPVGMILDGKAAAGPTPVQALAFGLAGCMAMDVVHILSKGRFVLKGLRAHLVGERRGEDPKYFTRIGLHFVVTGEGPESAVERALSLSRETYCSVWHSLRQDIEFTASFEILKGAAK